MNPLFAVETRLAASGSDTDDGTRHLGRGMQETRLAASLQWIFSRPKSASGNQNRHVALLTKAAG